MQIISRFIFGDICLEYQMDDDKHVGMLLVPVQRHAELCQRSCAIESLVQLHIRGDALTNAYGNGATMALNASTFRMRYVSQTMEGDTVITTLRDGGRLVKHYATWSEGLQAIRVSCDFINDTDAPITLELLSSFSLGGLTPFAPDDAPNTLMLHRARSSWSAEGLLDSRTIEELGLEPSWARHGIRVEKYGQVGSMPVRGFFPFGAVEDVAKGVTWAAQLAIPGSWQIELRRKDDGLCFTGGLADFDYGHWAKTLAPGQSFKSPEAYITVCEGGVDEASQRLLTVQRENWVGRDKPLPVLYNEYCATWGNPTEENIARLLRALKGKDVDYFVIDAGWFKKQGIAWDRCGGDWEPNEAEIFPSGLKHTADMIRAAGMKPGIWFEPETAAPMSELHGKEELLLKRDGVPVDTDNRRFVDMRKPEARKYLNSRVIGLLKRCGFEYIKVDYNDCIGVGCDGAESLGEGLRQSMEGTVDFFRELRREVPGLCIENCASGGHRLEPMMMSLSDMASFSDAHECVQIPIIAANLQRLILPGQSQIWAVLHAEDSPRRFRYLLTGAMLGVMCLSGDVDRLTHEQWRIVDESVAFYREVQPIIRDGVSRFFGNVSKSWLHPEGWQAVVRRLEGAGTLVVIHTFGNRDRIPQAIALPVGGNRVRKSLSSEGNEITLENGQLSVQLKAEFEAVAIFIE